MCLYYILILILMLMLLLCLKLTEIHPKTKQIFTATFMVFKHRMEGQRYYCILLIIKHDKPYTLYLYCFVSHQTSSSIVFFFPFFNQPPVSL